MVRSIPADREIQLGDTGGRPDRGRQFRDLWDARLRRPEADVARTVRSSMLRLARPPWEGQF